MTTTAHLVPLTRLDLIRAAGAHYPETVDGWRWAYRQRHERGIAGAFVRQGRRVLVDVSAYLELVRRRSAA